MTEKISVNCQAKLSEAVTKPRHFWSSGPARVRDVCRLAYLFATELSMAGAVEIIVRPVKSRRTLEQNAKLWAEPGRALVAEAGSTVTRVELRKGDALYLNDGAFGTLFDATHLNWAFPAKLLREQPSRAKLAPLLLG